jgi:hypothetical protein
MNLIDSADDNNEIGSLQIMKAPQLQVGSVQQFGCR